MLLLCLSSSFVGRTLPPVFNISLLVCSSIFPSPYSLSSKYSRAFYLKVSLLLENFLSNLPLELEENPFFLRLPPLLPLLRANSLLPPNLIYSAGTPVLLIRS